MIRRLLPGVLWGLVILIASTPLWVSLPTPRTLALHEALQRDPSGPPRPVKLPTSAQHGVMQYQFSLHLDNPADPLYLYIPLLSEGATVWLDGEVLGSSQNRVQMTGHAAGATLLLPLPARLLRDGENRIDLQLQTPPILKGYLSPLYVGTAAAVAPHYRLRVFLLEYLRLMVPAGQVLMAVLVLGVWLYRPREPLFGWLALLLFVSLFSYAGLLGDLLPRLPALMPYAFILSMAAGPLLAIVALLVVRVQPPRWLMLCVPGLPTLCLLATMFGVPPAKAMLLSLPVGVLGMLASLFISLWGALTQRSREAWLILLPLVLAVCVALRDVGVMTGLLEGPILLSIYYRPALMIGLSLILMRRLAISLNRLDGANEHLSQRLAERETELARLHDAEQRKAALRVRHEERQRLTVDLHDGLSGHLASIIALAERDHAGDIERTARDALDDLRVVILSLDISDQELGVALAGLRERLARQLKRLGITLDWSTAHLPDISGVTPAHALNVLRILQEAITNAIKHGQATHIKVLGTPVGEQQASLTVENNGQPFPQTPVPGGAGLRNMHRRAEQLGGALTIVALAEGTHLTLLLPRHLPAGTGAPPGSP